MHRDLDLERPAAFEAHTGVRGKRELQAEARLDVHAAQQRADEAVALRGVDDELAARDRALERRAARRLPGSAVPLELGAAAERHARELEPRAPGLAEQDHRRRRLSSECDRRACVECPRRRRQLDVERWPDLTVRLRGDGGVRGDRGAPVGRRHREGERLVDRRRQDDVDLEPRRRAGARRLQVDGERLERHGVAARRRLEQHREAEPRQGALEHGQQGRGVESGVAPVVERLELRDGIRHGREQPVEMHRDVVEVGFRGIGGVAGLEDALDHAEDLERGPDRPELVERIGDQQVEQPPGQVRHEVVHLLRGDPRQSRRGSLECGWQLRERRDQLRDRRREGERRADDLVRLPASDRRLEGGHLIAEPAARGHDGGASGVEARVREQLGRELDAELRERVERAVVAEAVRDRADRAAELEDRDFECARLVAHRRLIPCRRSRGSAGT